MVTQELQTDLLGVVDVLGDVGEEEEGGEDFHVPEQTEEEGHDNGLDRAVDRVVDDSNHGLGEEGRG